MGDNMAINEQEALMLFHSKDLVDIGLIQE